MVLDLTKLNSNFIKEIDLDNSVSISKEYFEASEIKELKDTKIVGKVFKNSSNVITIQAILSGIMILEDSISLELVNYPFSCEIDEEIEDFDGNFENILDITEILWQNIVLEVPLKFTNVKNFNEYQGDGWRLVDEDSLNTNVSNPFNELKDIMGEE